TPILASIRQAAPDLVITVLLGEETVRFHRAFAASGLARRTLRLALATDETLLLGIGPDAAENLFAADTFFASRPCKRRNAMLETYALSFGGTRPAVNVFSLGCYDAVHHAARLARNVGSLDGMGLGQGILRVMGEGAARRLPRARSPALSPRRRPPVHIAEADGTGFRVHATV
ncbi:MAG: ABC transporter substrate-binding protein, partial [Pseudomonadota bacterium]